MFCYLFIYFNFLNKLCMASCHITRCVLSFWRTHTMFFLCEAGAFSGPQNVSFVWFSFFTLDIAVELLQKSAPSPIRKLRKKYAAHVARWVYRVRHTAAYKCWLTSSLYVYCVCKIREFTPLLSSLSEKHASPPVPWCWPWFTSSDSDTETLSTCSRFRPLTSSWSPW